MSGLQAHFFVGAGWSVVRTGYGRGVSRVDLEKIRGAAERVARSEGLEIVDVEWKVGKQRFLRVYIDKVPGGGETANSPQPTATAAMSDAAGEMGATHVAQDPYPKISHSDCERVSKQLSVILDVEELIPGPGYVLEV